MRERVRTYAEEFSAASEHIARKYGKELDYALLSSFLAHHFEVERVHEDLINNDDFDPRQLTTIIEKEYNTYLGSIPLECEELWELSNNLTKAILKQDGMVWHIHKSDGDT